MRGKVKKFIRRLIQIILLGVFIYSAYNLGSMFYGNYQASKLQTEISDTSKKVVQFETIKLPDEEIKLEIPDFSVRTFTKEKYKELKERNNHFLGYLHFDSGLVSEAVVQNGNNDFYLKHDFNKNYNNFGTVFMDYENTLEDTNISVYGHSSDSAATAHLKFQPINEMYRNNKLLEENQYFSFYTENELRRYKISYIYDYGEFNQYDHRVSNFNTETEFNDFFNWIKPRAKFTGEEIKYGDKFISLQVCLDWNINRRVIVVAREVERLEY